MNAHTLLGTLTARGAVVSLDGGAVVVKPRAVLTEELRGHIRAHRSALVEALAHGNPFADGAAPDDAPPRTQFAPQTPDDDAREIFLLAATVLECARPDGRGLDVGLALPYWRAVCDLYGPLDARELAQWARATVAQGKPEPDDVLTPSDPS